MSIESLRAEIDFVLGENDDRSVAHAALNDFLRALHEVITKSDRDQWDLLSQVQTVLGITVAHHLAVLLKTKNLAFKSYRLLEDCPLHRNVCRACSERGISNEDGMRLFAHFLKAQDEERIDEDGRVESPLYLLYMVLGGEAAYHFGGLYVGDELSEVATELEYLDSQLKRFDTLVERWKMESDWNRGENQ